MLDLLREYEYCVAYKRRGKKDYKYILPNFRFWYADPMPVQINNRVYIFMEAYDKIDMKGKVAVSEVHGDVATAPVVIIDEPFHMSFPNVFRWNGKYYMIPETCATNQIRIYRMGDNVFDWKLEGFIGTNDKCIVDTAVIANDENKLILVTGEIDPKDRYKCHGDK